MGYTLKYEFLNNHNFVGALKKLQNISGLHIRTAYLIGKLNQHLDNELAEGRKLFQGIIKKYADLDEKGNPIVQDGQFVIAKDKQESFGKEVADLMSVEIEVPFTKFTFDDLAKSQAGLTPQDLMALEPVMVPVEVLEGGKAKSLAKA